MVELFYKSGQVKRDLSIDLYLFLLLYQLYSRSILKNIVNIHQRNKLITFII